MAATDTAIIKAKALRLLAQREYSRAELESKLYNWLLAKQDYESADAEECAQQIKNVVDDFQKRGWINDERVLESFINQKSSRYGQRRLQQQLQTKGLDEKSVQKALEEIKGTEFDRACHVWQKKFTIQPVDAASYNKQMRFLIYRGFTSEVIKKVLRGDWLGKNPE